MRGGAARGAPGSPGGRETAGQHRWVGRLSEDTNKVEMVKAMAHGAGGGQAEETGRTQGEEAQLGRGGRGEEVVTGDPVDPSLHGLPRPREVGAPWATHREPR